MSARASVPRGPQASARSSGPRGPHVHDSSFSRFSLLPEAPEGLLSELFCSTNMARRWWALMAFLLVRIAILGISFASQSQEALAFLLTKVEQYNSYVVSSRAMFATVASEDLWTSQNKDPVCSALSKRSLVAMEVLVRPSNGMARARVLSRTVGWACNGAVGGGHDMGLLELRGARCQEDLSRVEVPFGPDFTLPDAMGVLPLKDGEVPRSVVRERVHQGLQHDCDAAAQEQSLHQMVLVREQLWPVMILADLVRH